MDHIRLINSDGLNTSHRGRRSIIQCTIEPKLCVFCNKYVVGDEYGEHIASCDGSSDIQQDPIRTTIIQSTIPETPNIDSEDLSNEESKDDDDVKNPVDENEEHKHQALHLTNNIEVESHPRESLTNDDQNRSDDNPTIPETNNPIDLTQTEPVDDKQETNDDEHIQDTNNNDEIDDNANELVDHPTEEVKNDDQSQSDHEEVNNDPTRNSLEIEDTANANDIQSENNKQEDLDDDHCTEPANGNIEEKTDLSKKSCLLRKNPVDSDASADDHINDSPVSSIVLMMTEIKPEIIHTASVIEQNNQSCSIASSPIQFHDVPDRISRCSSVQFLPIKDDDHSNEDNHDDYGTPRSTSSMTNNENCKKTCPLCQSMIGENEFMQHMMDCGATPLIVEPVDNEPPIQRQESTILMEHQRSSGWNSDVIIHEETRECIICFKQIKESEYVRHVHVCLAESTESPLPTRTTTGNHSMISCFSCDNPVDMENHFGVEISCPSRHIYCFGCLQSFMEKYFRRASVPLCHPSNCDYELSSHDIAFLPLVRRISDRLLQLARGQQRPQCPHCRLYIDVNETEEFYRHIDSCNGDLIACRFCFHRYSIDQLNAHLPRCENDKSSSMDKLVNYITQRTKYPFKKEQINLFVRQKQTRTYSKLDPFEIINALTEYGPTFPYETPTKECDVCMEASPYDDIYVFDCSENHKLCYSCFHRSCETKMANGEILTCGICSNPLRDGELKQLRISQEEIQKFRDYQTKKTLDQYSNQTCGVIKCPNQNCSWIAEADDPTERLRVQCPVCKREFCSLCNEQYHYRTTCSQLPAITQQWLIWCEQDRQRYAIARGREQEAYAVKLKENSTRNDELRRRYEELMRDEEYKAQSCRLCPSCKRVVQRLEGCDKMICGQDAHGGNVQSGCGTKFNWQQAQPYQPSTAFQPEQSKMDLPKPEHLIEHIGVQCDQCKSNVVGIRFDCVQCPSLTFCEKCEQQATLEHSHENQRRKQQSHVFQLMIKPEGVSS